jgi:hypothetical protein
VQFFLCFEECVSCMHADGMIFVVLGFSGVVEAASGRRDDNNNNNNTHFLSILVL